MELVILSGQSGAGKSTAARYLEDMGFFTIDNVPPDLLKIFCRSLAEDKDDQKGRRYCLVTDARSIFAEEDFVGLLEDFPLDFERVRFVFLEAKDEVLLSRYKQSRRNHPLAAESGLLEAIKRERKLLAPLRQLATDIIDTSELAGPELRDLLWASFSKQEGQARMRIFLESFGFKHGLPLDSDLVYDVRFIPNPYYELHLRPKTGLDPEVQNYIFSFPEAEEYLDRVTDNLNFLLPYYIREGKMRLNIAIGCTGGQHRSVAFAQALFERFKEIGHYQIFLDHRDVKKAPSAGL